MEEHFFTCPHCWKTISILLDSSIKNDDYIEGCNPIRIRFKFLLS